MSAGPTPSESVTSAATQTFISMAPSATTSPSAISSLSSSSSYSISIIATYSPSDRGTPSITRSSTRARFVAPSRVPDPTAAIVVGSIFSSLFAFLVISALGAICKCLIWVETIGCGVGARPAIAGRYFGAIVWSLIFHGAILPVSMLLFFIASAVRGAFHRARMLVGFLKYAVKQTNTLPLRAPRLFAPPPEGFPREGPPGAIFARDTPLPWWDGDQRYGAENCSTRSKACLTTCGYDDDGFQTYQLCCVGPAAKCFAFGGQLLFVCSLRAGVQAVVVAAIILPIALVCIFVGAFIIHIPLGVLQASWISLSWRSHCYTAGPAFIERCGTRVGGAAVDALAAALTLAPVLLLNALLNLLYHFTLRLSPLAIAWTQVLAGGIDEPLPATAGREPTPSRRGAQLSAARPPELPPFPASGDNFFVNPAMSPIGFFPPPAIVPSNAVDVNSSTFGGSVSGAKKLDADEVGVDVKGAAGSLAPAFSPNPLSLPVLGSCVVCIAAPGVVQFCNGGHIACMTCSAIIFRRVVADDRWGGNVPRVRTILECPCAGAARVLGHESCLLLRPSSNPVIQFLLHARDTARLSSIAALVDAIQQPFDDDVLLCSFCPGVRSGAGACVSCERTAPLPLLNAPEVSAPAAALTPAPTADGPRWPAMARWTGELAFVFPQWSLAWAAGPAEGE